MSMSSQPAYSAALANQVSETQRDEWRPLNLIFVFDVGDTLMLNGATLRFFRYARVLRQRGHRVYFLVPEWSYNEGILQQLVDRGDIDGFSRLTAYYAQGWVNSVSKIFVHPRIRNRMLRNQQQDALHSLLEAIERWQCDLIVLSNRMYLFAIRELQERASVVIDWGDSFALAWWRTLKLKLRRRQMKGLGYAIRMLGGHILEEGYYPAFADANVGFPCRQECHRPPLQGPGTRLHKPEWDQLSGELPAGPARSQSHHLYWLDELSAEPRRRAVVS